MVSTLLFHFRFLKTFHQIDGAEPQKKPTKIILASFRLWSPPYATPSSPSSSYASTPNTASHANHDKINPWVSFACLYRYGDRPSGPSDHGGSAMMGYSSINRIHRVLSIKALLHGGRFIPGRNLVRNSVRVEYLSHFMGGEGNFRTGQTG